MVIPSLIQHKRDGGSLEPAVWRRLIEEYTAGRVPDYQMSALLMAIVPYPARMRFAMLPLLVFGPLLRAVMAAPSDPSRN